MALAEQRASEAIELLEPGSSDWFTAFTQMIYAACRLGGFDRVERWMVTVDDAVAAEGARKARDSCLCAGATAMAIGGRVAAADALIAVVERAMADPSTFDMEVLAHLHQARVFRATIGDDPGACLKGLQAALAAFEQVDDRRNACVMRVNLGYFYGELGDYGGAEATLRAALIEAERMGLQNAAATAQANLGQVLGYLGQVAKAREMVEAAVAALQQLGDPRIEGAARCYLAKIFLLVGDPVSAEREAKSAVEDLLAAPRFRALAVAILARALLYQGRADEALTAAHEMSTLLASLGAMEAGESLVRLTYAEVLYAAGDFERARAAIAEARERLLANAAKIGDPKYRKSFLENVPENARTLALAQEWLGGDSTTREAPSGKC
jgi:tetratricopeptide (TPR) repeat protein